MATAESNKDLANETGEALLTAIIATAPGANERGTAALRDLAEAYALVRGSMPTKDSGGRMTVLS